MFKKNAIISVVIIILTIVLGQITKANLLVDNKILEIKTVDEFNKRIFQFDSLPGESDNDIYINYKSENLEAIDRAEIIAIVIPTGNIEQYDWDLRQEVVIKEIIRGDKSLEGITTKLGTTSGFAYYNIDENRAPVARGFKLYFTGVKNLMQTDNEYLAFFNRILLEDYVEKNSLFYLHYPIYSYFNLSAPENDLLITDVTADYKFEDLKEYEFFTSSKIVLDAWYDVKREVIKKYLNR